MLGERVTQLLNVTQSLARLLDQENHMLSQDRPASIKSLAEEKARLAALYNRELRLLRSHRSQLPAIDAALRGALAEATRDFQHKLDMNQRRLTRLRTVGEGMIQAIGDEVARKQNPVRNYGANARIDSRRKAPTTLALDRQI